MKNVLTALGLYACLMAGVGVVALVFRPPPEPARTLDQIIHDTNIHLGWSKLLMIHINQEIVAKGGAPIPEYWLEDRPPPAAQAPEVRP